MWHTNSKGSNYKLRKMSFHNYGNPLRVSNCSPKGSTKDIINQGVKNCRGEKIIMGFVNVKNHNFLTPTIFDTLINNIFRTSFWREI